MIELGLEYYVLEKEPDFAVIGAQGRNRTGTGFNSRGILNPLRLPVSPPGLLGGG